jgi:hypothetical protein
MAVVANNERERLEELQVVNDALLEFARRDGRSPEVFEAIEREQMELQRRLDELGPPQEP